MQTSRFQLGLIATLAVGLGFSLSSSDAVGYPAGAAVSTGSNPVFSVGGQLSSTESHSLPVGKEGYAMVITDVMLAASDGSSSCRGNSRVMVASSLGTLASFAVGVTYDSRSYSNWYPLLSNSFESGLRVDPGEPVTISAVQRYEGGCDGPGMEIEYTVSGYYARP